MVVPILSSKQAPSPHSCKLPMTTVDLGGLTKQRQALRDFNDGLGM